MRCPKCHYLSFEPEPRCRNCGFGLSLEESDLPIKSDASSSDASVSDALGDLDLRPAPLSVAREDREDEVPAVVAMEVPAPSPVRSVASVAAKRAEAAAPSAPKPTPTRVQPAPTSELPLFVKGLVKETEGEETTSAPAIATVAAPEPDPAPAVDAAADTPLIKLPAEPRAPLGVRRKVADASAPRPARHTHASHSRKLGPLDRDLLEDLQRIEKLEQVEVTIDRPAARETASADRVGAGTRAAAAALDAALMGGLAAAVLAVTLRWCDIPVSRASVLPIAPTAAFLLLVGAGYLLMFTAAGGQTLGKMAFGIRVVGDDADGGLTVKQAVYRSLLTLPSVLALGAGFVPALLGDERALHDRLAHTRVVRA
jgi:uncharacterized RDD family membrane protein YckC